ncbi:MAG: hypothetical protein A2Z46_08340 [Nitrospirae bacterium RBG_19FT_COMBO_55_12]|nr:MAG: hypothetical protein A2Z46_08340 [Nitrospirae bacterium RBG_19FT_COMBO_55_12]
MARDLSGQSKTYLQSREGVDSSKFLPFYEYFDFKAEDFASLASQNVSFHFGGWARTDLADESYGKKTNNDLQYAYLTIRKSTANTALDLGRLFIREGVVSELVDGAYARTDLVRGVRVAAFGGVPVETNFDGRSGDAVYGGRISEAYPGLYRLGFSYLKERNNRTDFREEEGGDLWFRPVNWAEVLGTSSYNALTRAWMQHNYNLLLGPFYNFSLRTEATRISYKDYFTGTTTSAFTFLPTGLIDLNEKLSTEGGELSYSFGKTGLSAEYKKYSYDIAGDANYYGAKLRYSDPKNWGTGVSFHRMSGETDTLKYYDYRAYAYKKLGKADITADLFAVSYDVEINGVKNAYSASLASGYYVIEKGRLSADIEYAHNPYYDKEVRGFVKFVYNFGSPYGAKRGK